jgi:IclR family acetate operon transcriptional repressor
MTNTPVRSVKKALDLLEIILFEDPGHEGFELSQLARRMSMPANTAHNLLKTMVTCGFVSQNKSSRYTYGSKIENIGLLNHIYSRQIMADLQLHLKELSELMNESIVLTVLVGGRRLVIARCDANQLISIDQSMQVALAIYQIPTGRVLAAYADEKEIKDLILCNGSPIGLWDGVKNEADFQRECAIIKKKGVCEIVPNANDIAAFACPILSKGKLLGALGCSAPFYRCPEAKQQEIVAAMKDCAAKLAVIMKNNTAE